MVYDGTQHTTVSLFYKHRKITRCTRLSTLITSLGKEFLIYLPKLVDVFHSYRLRPKHVEQLFLNSNQINLWITTHRGMFLYVICKPKTKRKITSLIISPKRIYIWTRFIREYPTTLPQSRNLRTAARSLFYFVEYPVNIDLCTHGSSTCLLLPYTNCRHNRQGFCSFDLFPPSLKFVNPLICEILKN